MRGRIAATPAAVRQWASRFRGHEVHVAVEACTGWLFVCDALVAAGAVARLAEPVETRALRGRKRRAKTDREDARWLGELLADGNGCRRRGPRPSMSGNGARGRGCVTRDRRTHAVVQHIQATVYHQGVSGHGRQPDRFVDGARGRERDA
jgi:hypothetical protein